MLDRKTINRIFKGVIWDYNIDPYDLYLIALGKKNNIGFFNNERSLLRLLERLSWYEVLQVFETDFLKENLTTKLVSKMRNVQLREKYELIRKILHGETLSLTGWDIKNRERIKSSLLSNRWYSTQ